jgi:hypothetical protein
MYYVNNPYTVGLLNVCNLIVKKLETRLFQIQKGMLQIINKAK